MQTTGDVQTIAGRLRNYAEAISDPTRGMILIELDRAGELTATQLARRLGLSANNVYHHMRILRQLEVVDAPRAVPGDTYVEKYYQINPEIRAALRLEPRWYSEAQESMPVEDRKSAIVSLCLSMSHLLRRAAREYQEMDAEDIDRQVREHELIVLSINRVSRAELKDRTLALRAALASGDARWAEDTAPRTDLLLLAGLPLSWDKDRGDGG